MDRISVSSSNLNSIGFDSDNKILEIEFNNGRIYQYSNVSKTEFGKLMKALSKGTYFNSNIKDNYNCRRIR